jgi:hypothetical protein
MRREPIDGNAAAFGAVLRRTVTRMTLQHVLRACALGAALAGVTHLICLAAGVQRGSRFAAATLAFFVPTVAVLRWWRADRTARNAAVAIERADPSLRNLVITAAQFLDSAEGIRPYMRERVLREASTRASAIDLRRAVPLARDGGVLVAAVALALVLTLIRLPATSDVQPTSPSAASGAGVTSASDLAIELTPPQYTRRASSRLVNPAALDVLGGTEAIVRAPGGRGTRVRVNGADLAVSADGAARVTLTESGYLAVDAGAVHRLVPLTVTPDASPTVRITAPAKDLRFPSNAATIPIAAAADDDLGLASFELRYTVVSGTGEQFTFTEGTLPASVQRGSDRSWRLDARLALSALTLEPGDALIYRAVAEDRRPGGAGIASSDTFFVEIAGPGDVPLEGVEMPPDKERYAMSQAMIVLKLERLHAREKTLNAAARAEEAANIAGEQRAVRANFIFLLGGEVEDEEVEAEHAHEISEGRFANQARKDIVSATVLMGQVEKALAAISIGQALPPARAAVQALQRAFGNSRYLLRALPSRVRIDPARRLSGDTTSAANWDRALTPPSADPTTESARAALADLIAVSSALGSDARSERATLIRTLQELGERVLTAAARAPELHPSAKEIDTARTALAAGQTATARDALRRAVGPLLARAQQGRIESSTVSPDAARLADAAAIGRGGSR